ncbi:hypothetical protein H5410_051593 [Solanum commersonii]|uniref:Tubby-like F-box protein n=1 Tax=Solanum commersonii TaxID=4109 RepID=A0A9J5X166_SOLCO|nr:hypothetical protein H5410_051593 [Solanum commersonii]
MSFRSIVRDVRDSFGSLSRRSFDVRLSGHQRSKSLGSFHDLSDQPPVNQNSCWANLPPELLFDVIRRLEESENSWPARKHVVACASVCRSWRIMCQEIVTSPEVCGKLTFPVSLKQPGPRDGMIQCFIKRDKSNLTYHLFLCLSPALLVENGKFLLSAKRTRRTTYTEYVISMDAENISRSSNTYIGKLRYSRRAIHFLFSVSFLRDVSRNTNGTRSSLHSIQSRSILTNFSLRMADADIRQKVMLSKYTSGYFRKKEDVQETKLSTEEGTDEFLGGSNFLGTKFVIYDTQPPYTSANIPPPGRSSRRFYSKKVSPKVPTGSYSIAQIKYELNVLGTRGPRKMHCVMHSIPASAVDVGGSVPGQPELLPRSLEDSFRSISFSKSLDHSAEFSSSRFSDIVRASSSAEDDSKVKPLVLKNKSPRWHEQLQCWCLNFRGRVTVASVKNFQLIAAHQPAAGGPTTSRSSQSDHDKVILQFGKIGKDMFTMDYRYPLSAVQAFAICLSSFDTKLACE